MTRVAAVRTPGRRRRQGSQVKVPVGTRRDAGGGATAKGPGQDSERSQRQ